MNAAGLGHILHEHGTWLRQQSWYEPGLFRMDQSPEPVVLAADEVAATLGLTRMELFDNLGNLGLKPLRHGALVVFRRDEVEQVARRRRARASQE